MEFKEQDILQLIQTIWETTLGLPVERESTGAAANQPRSKTACIQISGAWNGVIVLNCPVKAARQAASVMFETDPAKVTAADESDAVAELANMIGGNIKGLLPETCSLSLPVVVEGGEPSIQISNSRVVSNNRFACGSETVSVTILEQAAAQAVPA
jgi:chemotaxis protein CheX